MYKSLNDIKEGDIINNILYNSMIKNNKNRLITTVGSTGSGKSWFNLRLAELWYEKYFKKDFPIENVGFNPEDLMRRLVKGNLVRGDILILEEGGTSMGNLDFQNKVSKLFNYILQSFRSKNISLIINLPYFSMLNKQTRMLMHMQITMKEVIKGKNQSIIGIRNLQTNQTSGKIYFHKPKVMVDGMQVKIDELVYNRPSQKLVEEYEKKKLFFVNNLSSDVLQSIENIKQKPLTAFQEKLFETIKARPGLSQREYAKLTGSNDALVSVNIGYLRRKGYNVQDYLRKTDTSKFLWRNRQAISNIVPQTEKNMIPIEAT